MADIEQSFPPATNGVNTTVGVELSGTGIVLATGAYEFDLTLAYGGSAVVSATPVDINGTAQSATVTAQSFNGPPSQVREDGDVVTAHPQPNGGGAEYYGRPVPPYGIGGGGANAPITTDVTGAYPTSDVASVMGTGPFTVTADNVGEALIEFTAHGRTGRLNVTVVQP